MSAGHRGQWSDVDAVLFDLDGTLVDTRGDFCHALQGMLDLLPPPFNQHRMRVEAVEQWVGKGSEHLVQSVLQSVSEAAGNVEWAALQQQALGWYLQSYARINGRFSDVYPAVLEGLQACRVAGFRMACVTNKPQGLARGLLQAKGLLQVFECVVGGDDVSRKKPDPESLLLACARLGVEPGRVCVVGDSSNDAQAAHAAGCRVALVPYGYNHGHAIESVKADWHIVDLLDMPWLQAI